jgi:hypothetical protein
LSRAGTRPVIDSEVKLELHRQAKVIGRRNNYIPNKYRKQEGRRGAFGATLASRSLGKNRRVEMIRKLKSGEYRLYSKKKDKSGKRKNLGTFKSRAAAEKHERAVQYFKRAG